MAVMLMNVGRGWESVQGLFVGWLLNVPATCECISGTYLLRQFYVLPHWDRSCRFNFPSHPVTVYWHWVNQSQHWPYNARRMAGQLLECQFLSHWYDLTSEKSRRKRDSKPESSALEADALTIRPTRRWVCRDVVKRAIWRLTSDSYFIYVSLAKWQKQQWTGFTQLQRPTHRGFIVNICLSYHDMCPSVFYLWRDQHLLWSRTSYTPSWFRG